MYAKWASRTGVWALSKRATSLMASAVELSALKYRPVRPALPDTQHPLARCAIAHFLQDIFSVLLHIQSEPRAKA